jgi:transcriptional regulator with GAF, ATPase, and Fis domain
MSGDNPNSTAPISSLRGQTTDQARSSPPSESRTAERRLVVLHSPDPRPLVAPLVLATDGEVLPIGRDVDHPAIRIRDGRMSRLHARITWDARAMRFRIDDAGSTNGLSVNGTPQKTALLEPSDVVRMGDTIFLYEHGEPMVGVSEKADWFAPSELGVLILGETGVGKEVLARRVHQRSGRAGDFVAVNCAALPRELAAAELFGHVRGAFSGAIQARRGLFVAAHLGTLFLDEVGELPKELQALLLRALEERKVRPIGSDAEVRVEARIVAATHRDLERDCREGHFREDLYARLAQVVIEVPPLRDRRTEILPLLRQFVAREVTLSPDTVEALVTWAWPHNIRELKALGQSLGVPFQGEIDAARLRMLAPKIWAELQACRSEGPSAAAPARPSIPSRQDLERLLKEHQGNIAAVARTVGKPRAQVYRWLRSLGLSNDRKFDDTEDS